MKLKNIVITVCICATAAFSYSYTAFPLLTGEKTLVLNPFLYLDGAGAVGNDIFLSYGLTSKMDVWSQISMYKTKESTTVDFSTMLRYDLGKTNILAVRASQSYVAPQYHFSIENDKVGIQTNVAAQITFEYYKEPAFYAIFCPLVKLFNGKMDIFTEINPGYYMRDKDFANLAERPEGFGLDIVPGIGLSIGSSLVSIACPIYNLYTETTPTFGMWWYCPITSK
jgi:hypothetical protein